MSDPAHPQPTPASLRAVAHEMIERSEHFILWTEHSILLPDGMAAHPVVVGMMSGPSRVRALLVLSDALTAPEGPPSARR